MPVIASIVLPTAVARAFAEKTDTKTSADMGYVIKDAISEAFGDGTIRPFRFIESDGKIHVIGYTRAGEVLKPTTSGKAILSKVEFSSWHAVKDQEVVLDVVACPMEKVSVPNDGRNVPRPRERDVGATGKSPNRISAYHAWLIRKLSDPNSGCIPIAVAKFTETDKFEAIRKGRLSYETRKLVMPSFRATIKVRVVNPEFFDRFIAAGIGRQRAFGYGSLIPQDALNDLLH